MKCIQCNRDTTNPKFCSRSCSATYTNKEKPKRQRTRVCVKEGCASIVKSHRTTLCKKHWKDYNESKEYKNKTIGEYRDKISVKGKHKSWVHSHIRAFCRSWLKHLTKQPCANCGYSKHVELCHIQPLSSFDDNVLLSEVNSEENVIQLCRNCHWELDNNLLQISSCSSTE